MKTQSKSTLTKNEELSRADLLTKLKEQNEKDIRACEEEVQKAVAPILEKYGCDLTSAGQWIGNQFQQSIAIIKVK